MPRRARHRAERAVAGSSDQQHARSAPRPAPAMRSRRCRLAGSNENGGESAAAPESARSTPHEERRGRAPQRAATREKPYTCWSNEARDAAEKLYHEKGSWSAVLAPFTKLAMKNGWGTAYTEMSIRIAVKNRHDRYDLSSSGAVMKAIQKLYEETGSWVMGESCRSVQDSGGRARMGIRPHQDVDRRSVYYSVGRHQRSMSGRIHDERTPGCVVTWGFNGRSQAVD